MVNYKHPLNNYFTLGGYTRVLRDGEKLKVLLKNHTASATAKSLIDTETDAVYVVPTGKKLEAIGVINMTTLAATSIWYQGDTEDATTTQKDSFWMPASLYIEKPQLATYIAGKYVTHNPSNTGWGNAILIGVELNA